MPLGEGNDHSVAHAAECNMHSLLLNFYFCPLLFFFSSFFFLYLCSLIPGIEGEGGIIELDATVTADGMPTGQTTRVVGCISKIH